jgi:hypothetical protein
VAEVRFDESKIKLTVSFAAKPEPLAVTFEVGGPAVSDSDKLAAELICPTARTEISTSMARYWPEFRVIVSPWGLSAVTLAFFQLQQIYPNEE